MRIKNSHTDFFPYLWFKKGVIKKRFVKLLLITFAFLFMSISLISYGIYLNRVRQIHSFVHFGADLVETKLSFIKNYIIGKRSSPPDFILDIKFKYVQQIDNYCQLSRERGFIFDDVKQECFPAILTYNSEKYDVSLSLTGIYLDHIETGRMSYKVKVKKGKTIFGMREFGLLIPDTRGFLSDWIAHMLQKKEGLIALRLDFINLTVNGTNKGIYILEEGFDTRLIENNRYRDGIIFKPDLNGIIIANRKQMESDPLSRARIILLENLWQAFINNDIPLENIFNIDKIAKDYAISDLISGEHSRVLDNMRYYFNPITNLIEPISREFGFLRNSYAWTDQDKTRILIKHVFEDGAKNQATQIGWVGKWYHKKFFENEKFTELYIKELHKMSQVEYFDSFFDSIEPQMKENLSYIYKQNPFYSYPKKFLYNNQLIIKEDLNPLYPIVKSYLVDYGKEILVEFQNMYILPVQIKYIILNDSLIYNPIQNSIIAPDYNSSGISFLYRFSSNDKKNVLIENENNFTCYFSILGLDEVKSCRIIPHIKNNSNDIISNPTTMCMDFQKLDFLKINLETRTIVIQKGHYTINQLYAIAPDFTVVCEAGVTIDLIENAGIISYSPISCVGTKNDPILLTSSDSTGQGICILNVLEKSSFNYVTFNNLSNFDYNEWKLTGAITFYETNVSIQNCEFMNNRGGDDCLNIVRSTFEITNSKFINTHADAFDADFSRGTISSSSFINTGNDAVDISGTMLDMDSIFMEYIQDKGLSIGEKSILHATKINIFDSEIAVCSKDMSTINLSNYALKNDKVGFTAYQKKPEYGPSIINGRNGTMENIPIPFLIEVKSRCTIDGGIISSNSEHLKEQFYGVKYGKSSK